MVLNTTYLGTKLDVCLDPQKDQVKKSILKYMTFIQRKLRSVDAEVREQLLVVLVRSLLIYHGTPLTAAGLWKKKEVDKLEVFLYRESAKLTN